jgi:hypothetical protein
VTEIVKSDAAKAQRSRVGLGNKSDRGERVSGQDGKRLMKTRGNFELYHDVAQLTRWCGYVDGFDYPSTDEDETPEEELERLRHWSGASVRQQKELTVPDHAKIEYLSRLCTEPYLSCFNTL